MIRGFARFSFAQSSVLAYLTRLSQQVLICAIVSPRLIILELSFNHKGITRRVKCSGFIKRSICDGYKSNKSTLVSAGLEVLTAPFKSYLLGRGQYPVPV